MTPFRVKPTVMDATMFMVQKIADSHLNQSVRAPTFGGGGATSINPASLRRSLLFSHLFSEAPTWETKCCFVCREGVGARAEFKGRSLGNL